MRGARRSPRDGTLAFMHMIDRFANDISARYDLTDVLYPGLPELRQRVAIKLREACATDAPRGLEIGCGAGHSAEIVLSTLPVGTLQLVDANHDLLRLAQERLGGVPDVRFSCVDAADYLKDQPDAEFDFCFSVYAFHNFEVPYRRALLQSVRRVLKTPGIFICGDRFFAADALTRLRQLEGDLRHLCQVLHDPADSSLLRAWVVHLLDDISPEHLQTIDAARTKDAFRGFRVSIEALGNGIDYVVCATTGP